MPTLGSPWGGDVGGGNLLRRELFRFQLEQRTPEIAPTASPLLTTVGALQRDGSVKLQLPHQTGSLVVRASGHQSRLDG